MKVPRQILQTGAILALSCTPVTAGAWHAIAGGGGTSTNSQYSITGTIGQPATAALAGGRYAVQSGFWGLIAAIQTPGAPPLQIINTGTNAVAVVWPTTQTLFSLQENTDLNTTNWVPVATPPTDDGTNNIVIIAPAAGNRFFRLNWP
jgi:hypothetical protein